MATPFPVSLYPIIQGAKGDESFSGVEREKMSDGTPHLWVLSDKQWRETELQFAPMKASKVSILLQYLYDNATTEFDLPIHGNTFTGFLWSDPLSSHKDGKWWVTIIFYGRKTA